MQIREYQDWLQAWDQARGWDRVAPAHTLIHALEELGEVARLVLQWEGYKEAESAEQLHTELEEELSDVFVFLFKLAYQTGVDVEAALVRGQAKADNRHSDLDKASAELARYPLGQELNSDCDRCKSTTLAPTAIAETGR
jgi:NTP pyrophosphatase (non-canonical NTP hydrolase)